MADLKISQLPNAGTLQDSDLLAVVQSAGPELVTAKTTVAALRNGGGGGAIIITTYQDIKLKMSEGTLVAGAVYIYEYTCIYRDRINSDTKTGDIKYTIAVRALSGNTFEQNATILENPKMEIRIDMTNSADWSRSTSKGTIVYMKDENGNESGFDFKNIKFRWRKFTLSRATDNTGNAGNFAYNLPTVNGNFFTKIESDTPNQGDRQYGGNASRYYGFGVENFSSSDVNSVKMAQNAMVTGDIVDLYLFDNNGFDASGSCFNVKVEMNYRSGRAQLPQVRIASGSRGAVISNCDTLYIGNITESTINSFRRSCFANITNSILGSGGASTDCIVTGNVTESHILRATSMLVIGNIEQSKNLRMRNSTTGTIRFVTGTIQQSLCRNVDDNNLYLRLSSVGGDISGTNDSQTNYLSMENSTIAVSVQQSFIKMQSCSFNSIVCSSGRFDHSVFNILSYSSFPQDERSIINQEGSNRDLVRVVSLGAVNLMLTNSLINTLIENNNDGSLIRISGTNITIYRSTVQSENFNIDSFPNIPWESGTDKVVYRPSSIKVKLLRDIFGS